MSPRYRYRERDRDRYRVRYREEKYINQRQNKKGTWSFQVLIRDKQTIIKTFSEKKYGSSKVAFDEAIKFRDKTLADIQQGIVSRPSRTSLERCLDESFIIYPLREETKRKLLIYFSKYITDMDINDVTRADILTSLNKMITTCSDDTIQRVFSIWKRIFKTAIVKEYTFVDMTTGLVAPKSQVIPKQKKNVLTDRETLDKVIDAIKKKFKETEQDSVITALEVMYYTGMRPCEVFCLSERDIVDGNIIVNKELGSDMASNGDIVKSNFNCVRKCKTDASNRIIPIPRVLGEILRKYESTNPDILFPDIHNNYYNVSVLGQRIHNLGIAFNMYQLRHTVATRLIMNETDQRTTTEILGHSNVNMSVYYARSNSDAKRKALEIEE